TVYKIILHKLKGIQVHQVIDCLIVIPAIVHLFGLNEKMVSQHLFPVFIFAIDDIEFVIVFLGVARNAAAIVRWGLLVIGEDIYVPDMLRRFRFRWSLWLYSHVHVNLVISNIAIDLSQQVF